MLLKFNRNHNIYNYISASPPWWFASQDIWQFLETLLVVLTGEEESTTEIKWVENRDVTKHPKRHWTASHSKELSGPRWPQIEKLWLGLTNDFWGSSIFTLV